LEDRGAVARGLVGHDCEPGHRGREIEGDHIVSMVLVFQKLLPRTRPRTRTQTAILCFKLLGRPIELDPTSGQCVKIRKTLFSTSVPNTSSELTP
jgi:hypothetical protein